MSFMKMRLVYNEVLDKQQTREERDLVVGRGGVGGCNMNRNQRLYIIYHLIIYHIIFLDKSC